MEQVRYATGALTSSPGRCRRPLMSRPPSEMPPPPGRTPGQGPERRPGDRPPPSSPPPAWARILPWLLILALIAVFALPSITTGSGSSKDLSYSAFLNHVNNSNVNSVQSKKNTEYKYE